jgi:hypothetical protein
MWPGLPGWGQKRLVLRCGQGGYGIAVGCQQHQRNDDNQALYAGRI